ncbi:MAG: NlpC/P60 family protein [Coprobacillaceae bacterium]
MALTKVSNLYQWGAFLNKKSGNALLSDCSGMIKGILWGYPNVKYLSNNVPDHNADTIISKCNNVSTDFSNIQVGEVVWIQGHIGVYVGNGNVVESTIAWENGIQLTNLRNINGTGAKYGRSWTKHGKLPYVDYTNTTAPSTPAPSPSGSDIEREAAQYGMKVATKDTIVNGFWISKYATIYGGASYGVKIPSKILEATTKYTCQQVKLDRGEYWVLAKEITSWVKVSECLVK